MALLNDGTVTLSRGTDPRFHPGFRKRPGCGAVDSAFPLVVDPTEVVRTKGRPATGEM